MINGVKIGSPDFNKARVWVRCISRDFFIRPISITRVGYNYNFRSRPTFELDLEIPHNDALIIDMWDNVRVSIPGIRPFYGVVITIRHEYTKISRHISVVIDVIVTSRWEVFKLDARWILFRIKDGRPWIH